MAELSEPEAFSTFQQALLMQLRVFYIYLYSSGLKAGVQISCGYSFDAWRVREKNGSRQEQTVRNNYENYLCKI